MAVFEVTSKGRPSRLADPNFDDFRDQNRDFRAIAKYSDYDDEQDGPYAQDVGGSIPSPPASLARRQSNRFQRSHQLLAGIRPERIS